MRKKISYICVFIVFIVKTSYAIGEVFVPPTPFATTWQTDGSSSVTIPLTGGGYDFTIDWGDGTTEIKTGSPGNINHTYSSAGVKTVNITPNVLTGFPRIYLNNYANRLLLKTIESWGTGQWGTSMYKAFSGASNLEVNATDIPNFSVTTSFQEMFYNCYSLTGANGFTNWTLNTDPTASVSFLSMFYNARVFNQPLTAWNVSRVTNMSLMFAGTYLFNQPLTAWDVSNVTNMTQMFYNARAFNGDISGWDVSNVTTMSGMFLEATAFNKPLNAWGVKTGKVTDMSQMFHSSSAFNQNINDWDVSKVTTTYQMFYRAFSFNQDLNLWDVSSLTNAQYMFEEAKSFNGNISSWQFTTDVNKSISMTGMFKSTNLFNGAISIWNTERVTNMSNMFSAAIIFNQDISNWNVSNVTNMSGMFVNAKTFNQDISNWNVIKVTNMSLMFGGAILFDQPLNWGAKTANVTTMLQMFYNTPAFNQDISGWDVSSVTTMSGMFMEATAFNKPLNDWGVKTGKVTDMSQMFHSTSAFNLSINNWDVSKVTNTFQMFFRATSFNQDLSAWDVSSVVNFGQMFYGAQAFNGDISAWQFTTDATKNIGMASIFREAMSFNQDISGWNVERVNAMQRMFQDTPFNQDISAWDVSNVTNLQLFLSGGKLSRANYDALLLGWSTLDAGETLVPVNLNAHFGSSKYSDTASVLTARNTTLIANKNWTITDGGMDADAIVPFIVSNSLASNNATISITFSENVYRTDVGSGSLETTDFLFSLSGGTATLNTTIPSSISFSNNLTFVLGIDINGTPNGLEVLTVTPILNSIFDSSGNASATTQSNNTVQLNDLSNPIITGPNSETGVSSSISINENTAAVHAFSANETITWSLGSTNDEALFGIDSSGNLVFTTAPDYETPSSTLNSNTYIVDVNATDTANNSTTQTLNITILDIANSTFGSFAAITKQYFTGTHTIAPPTTNNTNPIVYSSDNAAIATVSGSVITFTGVGTANITATQAADTNYEGNTISTLLTVLGKDLVSKYGGISSTDVNYISTNGNVGGAFGIDKYGKINNIYDNPDAPIIGTAVAGSTKASVSFTAPANTGGLPITSYTAMSSPGGFTGSVTQSGSGTITVTGLTNGTAYTFTVIATNAVGSSIVSAASSLVTPLPPPSIGDFRGGGVVFYVAPTPMDLDGDGDLDTALVCSIVDQSSGIQWYNGVYTSTGATGSVIGSGGANTAAIIASQGATTTDYAAGIAHAYSGGGYTDWFLPSSYEMATIITNKGVISSKSVANGGEVVSTDYPNNFYWSSTQTSNTTAIVFRINPTGTPPAYGWDKNLLYRVRAVRAF